MVTRIIAVGLVIVIYRCPAINAMAGVTVIIGDEVAVTFASSVSTIVTGCAITGNTLVIPGTACKGCRGMTVAAIQVGIQVSRNSVILAGCSRTVIHVTGIAACSGAHRTVIEGRAGKGTCVMAHTAILVSCHMRVRLAGCKDTIVAGRTVTSDTHVIKDRGNKACGLVTRTAILVSRHVIVVLTGCSSTVMARGTVSGDASVVERSSCECRGVMAIRTVSCSAAVIEYGYVILRQSRCIGTIVT